MKTRFSLIVLFALLAVNGFAKSHGELLRGKNIKSAFSVTPVIVNDNNEKLDVPQIKGYSLENSPLSKFGYNKQNISITNVEPIANFVAEPTNGFTPLQVEFTDLSVGYLTSWLWDFGDGNTSTEQNPVHVYVTADTFSVSLTVDGPDGSNTLVKDDYIVAIEAQPEAIFYADSTVGIAPFTVQFSDSSTGTVTEWAWDFGDGKTSNEQNPEHTFSFANTFTVTLVVTGPGGTDTFVRVDYITAVEPAPVAAFAADSTTGMYPLTVQFSDSSTGAISEWAWDFGDGTSSDEQNPEHVYETAGNFSVSLSVTGPGGKDSAIKTDYIVVDHPTGIDGDGNQIPTQFGLYQNYPNPFNPVTTISFDIPKSEFVELTVFNNNGQLVKRLVSENKNAGHYQMSWNALEYSSGIYYFKIKAGDFIDMKKMVLIK